MYSYETNLRCEICDWRVVSVCTFAYKEDSLAGENIEGCKSAEAEEGQYKEEQSHSILKRFNVAANIEVEIST